MTKNQIIFSLYKITCSATHSAVDSRVENNDYFKRRVLGFKTEIEFEKLINKKGSQYKFLEGGQFISKKLTGNKNDKNFFLYTTISSDSQVLYRSIYKIISEWDEVKDLFYIKIKSSGWSKEKFTVKNSDKIKKTTTIIKPSYEFYKYNKNSSKFIKQKVQNFSTILKNFDRPARKPSLFHLRRRKQFNYFSKYKLPVLKKIYATRYFIDVILRQARGRQIIDLDGFILKDDKIISVEIKEKTPIIKDPENTVLWKYGWDSRRILWYLYLLGKIQFPVLYVVRQISDRESRSFVQWDSIYIKNFLKGISWSNSRGGGGNAETLIAPYLLFEPLDKILNSI